MSREMPFRCPHGYLLGGHESFGHSEDQCIHCDAEQEVRMDRTTDLTMFAGYHLGWIVSNGGTSPQVTYKEIHAMIAAYIDGIRAPRRGGDGDPEGSDARATETPGDDTT